MIPTIALLGNPNCGKTTLFNRLTKSRRTVGNRMGVTVDQAVGSCRLFPAKIVDLPGIYSLSGNNGEETISRTYLSNTPPDFIFNIIDATNLERGLLLTTQLAEYDIPMAVVLNMTDLLSENGMQIDTNALSRILEIPVIEICASKNTGLSSLAQVLHKTAPQLKFSSEAMCRQFIRQTVQTVFKASLPRRPDVTRKLDAIVLHPILAIPIFCTILFVVFFLTFGPWTSALSDWLDFWIHTQLAGSLFHILQKLCAPDFIIRLFLEGILSSIGNVASFLPQLLVLFLLMSFLEDCGYLARCAFVLDGFFHRLGLSGKTVLPLILGFGCSVPAILATRTLSSKKEQRAALFMLPFLSCSARLPVYVLLGRVFFPRHTALILFALYMFGLLVGIIFGLLYARCCKEYTDTAFVLELPHYRMPTLQTVFVHITEKILDFFKKAGSVLFLAGIFIWLLENFDFRLTFVTTPENSMLSTIGKWIAPLFAPCGLDRWQCAVSLLAGVAAKEAILSTLGILAGKTALPVFLQSILTPASALSFLTFTLLYTPCISALCALSYEMNSRRLMLKLCIIQLGTAWGVACLVYHIGQLFLVS